MTAIEALVGAKEFAPAIARLEALGVKFRGTAIEKAARERRAELEKSPVVKAALNKAKREATARDLLAPGDQLKGKGQLDKAEKKYQLLRDKFADTEAGKEFAARSGAAAPAGG
jgi:hypothetical protein